MTALDTFRDHCRRMVTAKHGDECSAWGEDRWGRVLVKPDPSCGGDCLTDRDRAMFAALADEVDAYRAGELEPDLFGDLSAEPAPTPNPPTEPEQGGSDDEESAA